MGTCKLLRLLGDRSALEVAVERLRLAGVKDVLVVTGFHGEKVGSLARSLGCRTTTNPAPERGMLSSVQCGIAAADPQAEGLFLLPGDTPLVKPRTYQILASRFGEGIELLVPSFGGRPGHPPVIGRRHFGRILGWEGPMGLKGYFDSLPTSPEVVPVADQAILMDMDTPADYEALLDYWRGEDCPNEAECMELLELAGTPAAVREHGKAVARMARKLALALPREIEMRLDRLEAASLLHDVKKGFNPHQHVGADWLALQGYPALAPLVRSHHDLLPSEENWESRLLYLADKLTSGVRVVSPEGRLESMRERFGGDPAALGAAESRLARAADILGEVERLAEKTLAEILGEP
jgi:CTP:molybdopterin cytidylyltransferase MocA